MARGSSQQTVLNFAGEARALAEKMRLRGEVEKARSTEALARELDHAADLIPGDPKRAELILQLSSLILEEMKRKP